MSAGVPAGGGGAVIEVVGIDTPALGDRSYLATDGRVALVVDPQRDIDRVLAAAAAGRDVVAVDDGYDHAAAAGLRLVTGQAAARTA